MTQIAVSRPCPATCSARTPWLKRVFAAARQRRALARLDDRGLRDIGVTRIQAEAEIARPFWDAPDSWHKSLY